MIFEWTVTITNEQYNNQYELCKPLILPQFTIPNNSKHTLINVVLKHLLILSY